ncbi:MAG: hypothetical protein AAGA77_05260 [Bacteroidota bacterium]
MKLIFLKNSALLIYLLLLLFLTLDSCTVKKNPGKNNNPDNPKNKNEIPLKLSENLESYINESEIPSKLLLQLEEWNALPTWLSKGKKSREDWLIALHENTIKMGWPKKSQDAVTKVNVSRGIELAGATTGSELSISIQESLPILLQKLLEIINGCIIAESVDEQRMKIFIDSLNFEKCISRSKLFLGFLEKIEFYDSPLSESQSPLIQSATEFLYYHEFGHILASIPDSLDFIKTELLPEEDEYEEEILADYFAFIMTSVKYEKQSPDDQFIAFSGISLAMSLILCLDFCDHSVSKNGFLETKMTSFRMSRLKHWTMISVDQKLLTPQANSGLSILWDTTDKILSSITDTTSPIFNLIYETTSQPRQNWTVARNEFVKWYTFGNRSKIIAELELVYKSAKEQTKFPKAQAALEIFEYIIDSTSHLEPELGLKESVDYFMN